MASCSDEIQTRLHLLNLDGVVAPLFRHDGYRWFQPAAQSEHPVRVNDLAAIGRFERRSVGAQSCADSRARFWTVPL
jgi:hypothetical protein